MKIAFIRKTEAVPSVWSIAFKAHLRQRALTDSNALKYASATKSFMGMRFAENARRKYHVPSLFRKRHNDKLKEEIYKGDIILSPFLKKM